MNHTSIGLRIIVTVVLCGKNDNNNNVQVQITTRLACARARVIYLPDTIDNAGVAADENAVPLLSSPSFVLLLLLLLP